jgi:hypothetical protein
MVTRKIPSTEQSTVKVRIIDFEMSGSDQSLQESLQTIAAAFSRGNQTVQVSRRLSNNNVQGQSDSSDINPDVGGEESHEIKDVEVRGPVPSERRSHTARKAPVVKILNDVVFTNTVPTLKEFYEEKRPGKVIKSTYLVVGYWYKHHGGIEELTADHFHTAFRHIGFATPKDALQPMRDLKNPRDGRMMNGNAPNTSIINHLGENFVDALNRSDL